jgi:DNA-binding protein HU-beta
MAMSKSQIVSALADATEITKKQSAAYLDALAELAYKEAKNTFTLPGLGKLYVRDVPAREMVMRFGPKAGQKVKVAAKRAVKFRVAKAAKEAIVGGKKKK